MHVCGSVLRLSHDVKVVVLVLLVMLEEELLGGLCGAGKFVEKNRHCFALHWEIMFILFVLLSPPPRHTTREHLQKRMTVLGRGSIVPRRA